MYFDFHKAFDKAFNTKLLREINSHGRRGKVLSQFKTQWIVNYQIVSLLRGDKSIVEVSTHCGGI